MKLRMKVTTLASAMMAALLIPSTAWGQHKQQAGQNKPGMAGMKSEMATMMQSPHHQLMMTYMRSMADFARTLRDQAVKPGPLDVEFARATVAELRHSLDAMESLHQKHMGMMSAEMQASMKTMMEKMDKDREMLKDQVAVLETDVQAEKPDSKQVAAHANALLKQLGMMSQMRGATKAGKKKAPMKMKM
jgi:polyhydroxyalkanoate synthesis regulator phasin